jgi:hypothetical protein
MSDHGNAGSLGLSRRVAQVHQQQTDNSDCACCVMDKVNTVGLGITRRLSSRGLCDPARFTGDVQYRRPFQPKNKVIKHACAWGGLGVYVSVCAVRKNCTSTSTWTKSKTEKPNRAYFVS